MSAAAASTIDLDEVFASASSMEEQIDNVATGGRVIGYMLGITANVAGLCLAMLSSSVWLGVLIYFISTFLIGMLLMLLAIPLIATNVDKVEALGAATNRGIRTVKGWFSR